MRVQVVCFHIDARSSQINEFSDPAGGASESAG